VAPYTETASLHALERYEWGSSKVLWLPHGDGPYEFEGSSYSQLQIQLGEVTDHARYDFISLKYEL
jgi:hypothetical protein